MAFQKEKKLNILHDFKGKMDILRSLKASGNSTDGDMKGDYGEGDRSQTPGSYKAREEGKRPGTKKRREDDKTLADDDLDITQLNFLLRLYQ